LLASVGVALLALPAVALVGRLTAVSGGDGLSGVFPAGLTYLLALLTSWGLAIAGWLRGERPRWLVPLAFVLGLAPLAVLAL